MTVLERLSNLNMAPLPQGPLLVLAQPGLDPMALALIVASTDRLVIADHDEFLLEMSKAFGTMTSFDPLVGHRFSQQETGPDHPWYGAELTDAAGMADALAQGVALHLGAGDRRMLLLCQTVFWELRECKDLVDFVLGWDRHARLLMVGGTQAERSVALADRLQWRLESAQSAVDAMDVVYAQLDALHGDRAMIWEPPTADADTLPVEVAAFLT